MGRVFGYVGLSFCGTSGMRCKSLCAWTSILRVVGEKVEKGGRASSGIGMVGWGEGGNISSKLANGMRRYYGPWMQC